MMRYQKGFEVTDETYLFEGAKDYFHLCKVDNTLFYAKSPNEDRLKVRDFAKEVGYN